MTEITGSFVSIDDSNITTSKTSVQQLIDIVQADISSDAGSGTRKKYQVFVSGGTNLASITSSLYQTVFDQDFTLGTSNPLFDITIGSYLNDDDENNKMNLSVMDVNGSLLVVSQFTLCGSVKKGRRPSFVNAETPELSFILYENLITSFKEVGIHTFGGSFGKMMNVELINEGPATFIINSKEL